MVNIISNGKVFNATKWSSLAEIAARISSPIVNMILARLLTPDAFGIVASITIITSFADIFTDAGFQKFVIQHEYRDDKELDIGSNVAFTANFFLAIFVYIMVFVFRTPLAIAVGCNGEELGISISCLAVFCTAIPSVATARFRRDLNFKPLFFIRTVSAFIPLIVTVPLAFVFHNYWALIIGTLLQKMFVAITTIFISKWKPKVCFNFEVFKQMFGFSVWNLLESLSIWFAGQANIFIVGNLLDSYYLGLYKTAMSTVNSCLGLITAAFTPVFFSTLSRYQNDLKQYIKTFNSFQYILGLLVIPLGAGIFMYREFILTILLGSQWLEATTFLGLWALISTITIVYSNTACEVYRSYGKPKVSLILQVCYLIIYVPTIYICAKSGFTILSYVSCFIRLIPVIADFIVLNYMFKLRFTNIINNTGYIIVASLSMTVTCFFLQKISNSFIWNIVGVFICILVYFSLIIINPKQRARIMSFNFIK